MLKPQVCVNTRLNAQSASRGSLSGVAQGRALAVLQVLLGVLLLAAVLVPMVITPLELMAAPGHIDQLKSQQNSLESQRQQMRRKKQEKLQKVRALNSTIFHNQMKLENTRRNMQSTQQQKVETEKRMGSLKSQIDRVLVKTTTLEKESAQRLRSLYMGERITQLQMILDSRDLSTLLDRAYYRQRLVSHDHDLMADLRQSHATLEKQLREHDTQKRRLETMIVKMNSYQSEISQRLDADRVLRNKYATDAAYYERAERELLAESNRIRQQILAQIRDDDSTPPQRATGHFQWPVHGKITSNYGYRYHPIHRRRTMHTGLDISKPSGTPIAAADGGRILFAGWKGGYGKAVIINHGKRGGQNFTTLYGHMSSISVHKGQTVSKGQTIGRVGSTGYSTGPHLHFEVRVNGATVNPRSYL